MKNSVVVAIALFALMFSKGSIAAQGKCPDLFDRVFAKKIVIQSENIISSGQIYRFGHLIWGAPSRFSKSIRVFNDLFTSSTLNFLEEHPQFLPFWQYLVKMDRPDYDWTIDSKENLIISGDYFGLGRFTAELRGENGPKSVLVTVTTVGRKKGLNRYFRTLQNAAVDQYSLNTRKEIAHTLEFSRFEDFLENQARIFNPIKLVRPASYSLLQRNLTRPFDGYSVRTPDAFVVMGRTSLYPVFSTGPEFEGLEVRYLINGTVEILVGRRVGFDRMSEIGLINCVKDALKVAEVFPQTMEIVSNGKNPGKSVKLTFQRGFDAQVTLFLNQYFKDLRGY